jgi:hypothetical protein
VIGDAVATTFQQGDLVQYTDGNRYDVDEVIAATAYRPARVVLGRDLPGPAHAEVLDVDPGQLTLICRAGERTLF